ncbi:MAG: divergent polysaccharide deacetylase family protein [Desulfobacterales bacterium]|nr:divergent polysaccharide deacetylase family protein [Desulfobacterales bacterium]MDX2510096.1 divergent polysaccharide deacetylase family protein [Desulfobacterales bacterium]
MVKRKTKKKRAKKKARKKSPKKTSLTASLIKIFFGFAILLLLVFLAGLLTHHLMLRKEPVKPIPPSQKPPITQIPTFEIYPEQEIPPEKPPLQPEIILPDELPKVAIIIDDLGYDRFIAKKFLALDGVFTFSVLPHGPFTKRIAKAAAAKGYDIMLHLPMEPIEYPSVNPGPGALLTSMSPDELIEQLRKDLDDVPSIKGVNNHMGSRMTTVSTQMYQIFSILKQRNLFFIDSRSTAKTVCEPSARLLQIPFAQRDVFIDHIPDPDFIRKQLRQLVRIAKRKGVAVGIAHPHKITYKILSQELPELKKKVQLVPASSIVKVAG